MKEVELDISQDSLANISNKMEKEKVKHMLTINDHMTPTTQSHTIPFDDTEIDTTESLQHEPAIIRNMTTDIEAPY